MVALQIVGGGRMGEALRRGLLGAGGMRLSDLHVVEVDPARREALAGAIPGVAVDAEPDKADGTVLAVKPADVPAVCAAVAERGTERVLSIAAGVTIATIETALSPGTPVVRAMPNTPALVGAGRLGHRRGDFRRRP